MSNTIAHFAINADDVARARRFYEAVFGWRFTSWGPPEFFQIETGDAVNPGLRGVLQRRRELLPGVRTIGYECTIAVPDVDAAKEAVTANGGRVIMEKTTIAGVGYLIFFEDPEGNVAGAMQYDTAAQ